MKLLEILVLALSVLTVVVADENNLVTGTRKCAATLYKELIKYNDNVIFSPISLQTIMALLASAANNQNAPVIQQIRNSLSLPSTKNDRDEAFRNLLTMITKEDNDFKILDATKIYFQQGYTPKPDYQNVARDYYRSELESVNFRNGQTYANINEWVSEKTNGYINNLLSSYDITRNTKNFMVNTLYLQGKWLKPFLETDTFNGIFKSPNGHKTVPMMHTNGLTYNYYEDTDAQYLQLEMVREGDAFMVIVLPKQNQGLANLENNIHHFIENKVFKITQVDVTLPKFVINKKMKLQTVLKNIGVTTLFSLGAQLTGIRVPGHPYVKITDVTQQASIDVNEFGVTAIAASTLKANVDATNEPPQKFIANQPFFFYITVQKAVVFAGRVKTF